jgi:hypothetical protein
MRESSDETQWSMDTQRPGHPIHALLTTDFSLLAETALAATKYEIRQHPRRILK